MKRFILVLLVAVSATAMAQKFSIQGQLVDTLNAPLPSATVLLLNPKDSSLVNFSVGDVNGNFQIKNVSKGEHLFKVTFMGFRSYMQKIITPETGNVINLGQVRMIPASSELEAIEISAEKAPVTVKRDTIEFNAGSFKTKQNAMVEDLLKKLPGVEVDNQGNITAQGEQVRRVTVDGKNFFGSDPKVATRNLPADAIDKVQVFDKKSDQAAFSGIDDGQREKTINLELKEEKRNGAFGTLLAGAGTDDRFQARGSINRFTKGRQLSFLGMGNNTNEQGFSMEDYMNFTGGAQQMMGGGGAVRLEFSNENANGVPLNFGNRANGIMTNYAGGVNLNNTFSNKTEVNGSYFYNYIDHDRDQSTMRENAFRDRVFNFNQNSIQRNTNENHRANMTLDYKIDSANTLKLTANLTYNATDSDVRSSSQTLTQPDNILQNESQRLTLSTGVNQSLNSSLLWRHRFAKKGRTFSTNLQFVASQNDRHGKVQATNQYYVNNARTEQLNQTNEQENDNTTLGATLSFTEPLGNRKYLEANYSFRQNSNDVSRVVFDEQNEGRELNLMLTNSFTSDYVYHRPGFNFRMNKPKMNLALGASVQSTTLLGDMRRYNTDRAEWENIDIDRTFQNMLPSVRFNYEFSTSKNLRFDYETSVQEPSIQQLQPVIDNADPLNIYEGNPSLKPSYAQSWRLNFTTFNPVNFLSFFAFMDVDYITNAITNARTNTAEFVSLTKPVNVDNNMSVIANVNLSFPINRIKSRLSIGSNVRNFRSINLLNEFESSIDQQSAGGSVNYSFRYNDVFDLSLGARLQRQLTSYEFNQPDQLFLNNEYTAEANWTLFKNYQLTSNFELLEYESQGANFYQTIPLLNVSFSRYMLKNKTGELKLSVNNLFDQALGVNQTASLNFIERQTTNSLGRFFMVSFIYSINKQLNPMGMRRGGAMFRVIR